MSEETKAKALIQRHVQRHHDELIDLAAKLEPEDPRKNERA